MENKKSIVFVGLIVTLIIVGLAVFQIPTNKTQSYYFIQTVGNNAYRVNDVDWTCELRKTENNKILAVCENVVAQEIVFEVVYFEHVNNK